MDEKTLIGSITFSNIANPNTWDIGEQKALVFSCPSEAKRGEELFTAMQEAAFKAGREAGMREAAALCEAKADSVFAANPGRKRGTVSDVGGYAGHLIKDLGNAILSAIEGAK